MSDTKVDKSLQSQKECGRALTYPSFATSCLSGLQKKMWKCDMRKLCVIMMMVQEVKHLTMRTSPPPRIRGTDSAWMSVGSLRNINKSILLPDVEKYTNIITIIIMMMIMMMLLVSAMTAEVVGLNGYITVDILCLFVVFYYHTSSACMCFK